MSEQSATAARRELSYADVDAIIADIRKLQGGYVKVGNWSLAQACWHLNFATSNFIAAGPHPEGTVPEENRQKLRSILTGGKLPGKIVSPERAVPPSTAGEADIEAFIETLKRLKTFGGPFAPHRLFGPVTLEEGFRLVLIHCGHHLSHLVPTTS